MEAATLIPSDPKVNPLIHSDPKVNPEGFGFCNSGPNLLLQKGMENRILAQASSLLPHASALTPSWATPSPSISSCSALQPSWLSSTSTTHPLLSSSISSSSHLLSSTVFSSSSLLSTKNTQLKRDPLSSSLCSPPSTLPLLHSTSLSAAVADPPQPEQLSVALKKRKIELESLSSNDYTTSQIEELNEDLENEDLVEMDSGHTELPVLDLRLSDEEEKQTVDVGEVFTVSSTDSDRTVELLKEKKYILLNVVCCSLVNKSSAPNQNDWDSKKNVWTRIKDLGTEITRRDPEFILKVAVYTRQELNIRITTNFLLALAAYLPESKPHLRRYFCAAVQLPSDWLEVTRLFSTCFSSSLPACLKKALVDKFKQFSEYQLAKYNTRKLRGKHNKKKREVKESTPEQWEKWAQMLKVESDVMKKMVEMSERPAVDKKQSEFNMKKMIKRLHIKEPAEFVMGILGKRYPSDLRAFVSSGLSGVWESERAGQRMKLKQPDTWETKLSLEGNNAAVWEKLIDNNSLPFMAMLRNLRNMITQGISDQHHERILKRLTSKNAVIQSRQFPFRFLSAYKVIMELNKFVSGPAQQGISKCIILRKIVTKLPKCRRYRRNDWSTASRKKLLQTLGVPVIYGMCKMKLKQQKKFSAATRVRNYTPELLVRYRQALEKAVQISCRYNIPPLPGRTIIIFRSDWAPAPNWKGADDICVPSDPSEDSDNTSQSASLEEAAVLLAVMISHCCEHPMFLIYDFDNIHEVKLKSDVFLENVKHVMKELSEINDSSEKILLESFFFRLTEEKTKVDNIILLNDVSVYYTVDQAVEKYRKESLSDPLLVNIMMRTRMNKCHSEGGDSRSVYLSGFSEQILRFVSERGSSRFLDHVESIDKLRNIPPPAGGSTKPERAADITPLPVTPKLRWQGVRVFISSTFRDMHAERDVLVRSVFPELRRRAAPHCLYLQEVELRWGVTEEESYQAIQLCLSEVCRSQLLLSILGERYGQVPPRPTLPELPQYTWLNSAPDGMSITEMEIRQFQAVYPDSAQGRMFFYFRSPHLASSVPVEWREDFTSESSQSAAKMSDLKEWIRSNQFRVTEDYPCEWGGAVDGRPYVKGLEDFAKAALEDLWEALEKLFVEEVDEADLMSEINEQEVHQDAQQRHFYGRKKLVSSAIEKIQECQQKGGILLVEGAQGEGKTAFMAGLAHALQTPDKRRKVPVCDVISYSTEASQSASGVEHLLRCLIQWLRRRKQQEEELVTSTPYRELLCEFLVQISELKRGNPLVILVDGADVVHDPRGQAVSEWIPQHIPKGVCLVLSVTRGSALRTTLSGKQGCVVFGMGQLSLPDRKEIVQKELSVYGKKLSDSAFNNQLQTLLMKKGAVSPLYLHFTCEELRNYASFETMKRNLQTLPPSLCELVQHSLLRLQSQYGAAGLDWTLAALTVSSTGLRERDLYAVLNLCSDLISTQGQLTWNRALTAARSPRSRVPMALFSQLAQGLQGLIRPSLSHEPDEPLTLTHPDVKLAFEQLYLSTDQDRARAHLLLAAHLWVRSDPLGNDTFLHCEADALLHLPAHLMESSQWQPLLLLLSSYYFLFANVLHGLLHSLLETYILFAKRTEAEQQSWTETSGDLKELQACHSFLKRHAPLLSCWPRLFVQQALNEAAGSSAHAWARTLVEEGGVNAVRNLNNTDGPQLETGELVSTFQAEPSCVALSPGGGCVAVGTEQGTIHFIHTHTNQEVKSLVSNCDGISSCVFLDDGFLSTTSYDGQVEVWDINSGSRTVHLNAHSNRITGCDVSSDKKHFATVSLDSNLKVWSSQKGKQVVSLLTPCPLNCVTFDPEGGMLAVGCWDRTVRVWNWIKQERWTTLSGHQSSVRSVSFSPSSSLLCSGSLDGEVLLWSSSGLACVGRYQAHRGSTEALSFLPGGETLLSAGHDGMVQLWSGGLGCSVSVLGEETKAVKSSVSRAAAVSESAALSVAGAHGYAAVGYHGDGIRLFELKSGERVWSTEDLRVSVPCLLWMEAAGVDLLLSGALDSGLRLWSRQGAGMTLRGAFGVQKGGILSLAQSSVYVASASDDFTIALWLKSDLTSDPWVQPSAVSVLRGHSGGVTCLAFSPDGDHLLSGGKDKALMVWKVDSSPPVLSRSLPHCHGDWITDCAWTPAALLSCSSDCRLRLWDVQTGRCLREVSAASSLSALSCWEDYVMLGCADGLLMVWKSDIGVIAEIHAHQSRVHHSTIITAPVGGQKVEELVVATASDDGTVKVWLPLQVQHRSTLLGHSGAVQALASGRGPQFLTVSEDRSLRAWSVRTENPPFQEECVSAVCFLDSEKLLVCGYNSGKLEIWHNTLKIYSSKVSDSRIRAVSGMPDQSLAVGCSDYTVTVFKLTRDHQHCTASLTKGSLYTLEKGVNFLCYCNTLMGVCVDSSVIDIFSTVTDNTRMIDTWQYTMRTMGVFKSDVNSLWLLGEENDNIHLSYLLCASAELTSNSTTVSAKVGGDKDSDDEDEKDTEKEQTFTITAATMHNNFIVCGDSKGNMWFNNVSNTDSWSPRRPVHSDRISVLRLTDSTIISASHDRTVKLWDRTTNKQVGLFVCAAAVEVMEVDPADPCRLVCGDALGKLYFLSWKE
ncbi:telomerase protein component 1 [Astyanax mexicanus]|uniref:telomerase protein component 1 n=1 Tax=Astyanax mexicanus TaxID=7994 RepID=UPI0020CB6808|nr:telomerase protein component 1 [Astyanax mexicanus]